MTYNSIESIEIKNPQVKNSGRYITALDLIFPSDTAQDILYNKVASSTVRDVLKGYNGTILTYGQSGSGKTYSMYGTDIFDHESKGIVPRAMFCYN